MPQKYVSSGSGQGVVDPTRDIERIKRMADETIKEIEGYRRPRR